MAFRRPPAADDPDWNRASAWLAGATPRPDLLVVGVPTAVGSISPSRADTTPAAVREALRRLSTWDADRGRDVADLAVSDLGDWPLAALDLEAAMAAVAAGAAGVRDHAPVTVFLGGDNAITRPLVTGMFGPDLADVGVLTFDAHHDVRSLRDGPRNGTPIRGLVEVDGLPGHNVAQVGIAPFANAPAHARWAHSAGITVVPMAEVAASPTAALDRALAGLSHCRRLYVDIDVDVLDVAYAPACPGARPGGMAPGDLLACVRRVAADARVQALDLVEVDAAADHEGRTVLATAQLLLAIASGALAREAPA